MAGHRNWRVLYDRLSPDRKERVQAKFREMQAEMLLAEIRKIEGVTQAELAERLGIKQPSMSQLESQDDMQISTLRRIVEALGGELDITIRMPNGSYRLAGLAAK